MKLDEVSEMANAPERFERSGSFEKGGELLDAIERRRSIRRYTGEPVDEEMLKAVLYAGFCAPTAVNRRPYHFVLVENRPQLARLAEASTYARMLAQAACGIVVCGDRNLEDRSKFLYEDCAAAIQNMLLAIHGLGLGGVWCGVTPESGFAECLTAELGLPPGVEPVAVIALGRPDEEREPPPMWEPEKLHRGGW